MTVLEAAGWTIEAGWLSHCLIYASERQWLTEGVPASWRCQCQSTFSAPQMRGILRCANTPYRGVKERRESRSNTEHTLRACCDLVPATQTKTKSCVSYIPVHTPTPPTSLRRAWRCLHLSRPCHRTGFIPGRGVWLARGEGPPHLVLSSFFPRWNPALVHRHLHPSRALEEQGSNSKSRLTPSRRPRYTLLSDRPDQSR